MGKLICGDLLKVLPKMPAQSVDLIIGSPPYEDARTYSIDFNLKGQDWVDWMVKVYIESLRVCKGLVAFVIEGRTQGFRYSATPALLMADLHRAGICLRKPPIYYRSGMFGSGSVDWLRNDYEFIICATNGGKLPWSDNTAMGHTPKYGPGGKPSYRRKNGTRVNQWGGRESQPSTERLKDGSMKKMIRKSHIYTKVGETPYHPPAIANPGNVIHCKVGRGHMGGRLCHRNEAPFSDKLAKFFIKSFCPPDGVVMDPFVGSGTVPVVAQKTGRRWIGIDIRQSQIDLSWKRLECETHFRKALIT